MGKLGKGITNILRDYSGWTGTHGVPHIGMAQNMCLRVFWSIVFVFSLGMFIWQMSVLFKKYYSYEVNVETELKFSERVFPAVTTCHLNPWKASEVEGTPIEVLIEKYKNALTGVSDSELSEWGFQGLSNPEIQKRAMRWSTILGAELNLGATPFIVDNITVGYNYSAAYNYSDLVMNCAYNTEGCNISDFMQTYDPQFGLCYTFNYDERYNSSRAGPLYGLRMLMRVYQQEYLPWTEGSGVVVAIHGQNENPFADVFGYFAPPGTAASLGVRFVQTSRLPKPYGECTLTQSGQAYYYNGTYLVEGCFRSCIQDKIIATCGCYDPAYAPPDDASIVSCSSYDIPTINTKIDCVNKLLNGDPSAGNSSNTAFNVINECVCPQPCEESAYSVTVSTALWPSDVYKPPECNDAELAAKYWPDGNCLDWYKDNTLLVEVYYERMNYQLLSESPAYTVVNMVSDVGGQLGLWIGASLISVIEFLTLLVLLCCYCATRVKANDFDDDEPKKQQPADVSDSDSDDDDVKRPNTATTSVAGSSLDGIYKHDTGTESVIPPKIKD